MKAALLIVALTLACCATTEQLSHPIKILFHFSSPRTVACYWVTFDGSDPTRAQGDFLTEVEEAELEYPSSMEWLECSFAEGAS